MKSQSIWLWALCITLLVCQVLAEDKAPVVEVDHVTMYVPIPDLEERFGTDAEPLSNYVKAIQAKTSEILSKEPRPTAKGLLIAVGIKSKTKTKIWCQAVEGEMPAELLHKLEKALGAIEGVDLKKSPAGFGLSIKLFGQTPAKLRDFPDLWFKEAKKTEHQVMSPPDELFKIIWPDK